VILAAAIACAGGGASAAGRASPFPSGWIVFSAADLQHGIIAGVLFRIRTNGTRLRQITKAGIAAEDPAFAPDGKRVAFRRDGILTVKLDGSGLRRLTRHPDDTFPAYSPDGKRIAFIRGFRLYVMQADGRGQHLLPRAPRVMSLPSWTPDGKSIVLAGGDEAQALLYTLNARTGRVEKRAILEENALAVGDTSATLSPNGRTVAFLDRRPPPPNCEGDACDVFALYRKPAAGGPERRVCNDCGAASWSADSRVLLYIMPDTSSSSACFATGAAGRSRSPRINRSNGRGPPGLQP
jgi:Tol biopolymer transport system component